MHVLELVSSAAADAAAAAAVDAAAALAACTVGASKFGRFKLA